MKRHLIEEYLLKYPDYPKRTLAKLIIEENPDIGNIDSVRKCIRILTGSAGKNT